MFTEFITNLKNSISLTDVSCNFLKKLSQNLNLITEKSMSPLLAKFLSHVGPLLACRAKILLFLHWSSLIRQFGSSEVMWKSDGLDPGQNINKGIRINFLPIENEYIFLSFCPEVCQNKHLLDLSLSKSHVLGEDPVLDASLPFWNVSKVWSCSGLWDLLQVDDLHPSSLLRTNCSEISRFWFHLLNCTFLQHFLYFWIYF